MNKKNRKKSSTKDVNKIEIENVKENKKKKNKKKHPILRIFLIILILIVLGIAGFLGYSYYKNGWGVKGVLQTALGQDKEKLKDLDPFTVLILGVSDDIEVELTDTIIIASYNPKTQKATLVSIPRDTYVGKNKNTATSYDKINALYQKSVDKTLEAVNKLTGLEIEYYVVVNNNALVELVDAIGGVEFDVPIDMKYDDTSQDLHINLKKGLQVLDGEQAEHLVRFRKNNNGTTYSSEYGDNDMGRMRTQRDFLKAVAKQTLKLKNITKIKSFINIFKENVTTNITDWNTVLDYIPYAVEFDTENIQMESLPGASDKCNGLWFYMANTKQTKALIEELILEQNGEEDVEDENNTVSDNTVTSNSSVSSDKEGTSAKIKVELLNGSGDSTVLTKVTKLLKQKGYNVYKTGTTTVTSKTTIVSKSDLENKELSKIKDILGVGNISESKTSGQVDVTIIIGKDYK